MQATEDEHSKLEVDPQRHSQPVKITQQRLDVVRTEHNQRQRSSHKGPITVCPVHSCYEHIKEKYVKIFVFA